MSVTTFYSVDVTEYQEGEFLLIAMDDGSFVNGTVTKVKDAFLFTDHSSDKFHYYKYEVALADGPGSPGKTVTVVLDAESGLLREDFVPEFKYSPNGIVPLQGGSRNTTTEPKFDADLSDADLSDADQTDADQTDTDFDEVDKFTEVPKLIEVPYEGEADYGSEEDTCWSTAWVVMFWICVIGISLCCLYYTGLVFESMRHASPKPQTQAFSTKGNLSNTNGKP